MSSIIPFGQTSEPYMHCPTPRGHSRKREDVTGPIILQAQGTEELPCAGVKVEDVRPANTGRPTKQQRQQQWQLQEGGDERGGAFSVRLGQAQREREAAPREDRRPSGPPGPSRGGDGRSFGGPPDPSRGGEGRGSSGPQGPSRSGEQHRLSGPQGMSRGGDSRGPSPRRPPGGPGFPRPDSRGPPDSQTLQQPRFRDSPAGDEEQGSPGFARERQPRGLARRAGAGRAGGGGGKWGADLGAAPGYSRARGPGVERPAKPHHRR